MTVMILGTAQLGMPYGGLLATMPEREAFAILDAAYGRGCRWVDTARAYGDAEGRIGRWLARSGCQVEIVTKMPGLGEVADTDVKARISAALLESQRALGRDYIEIYLAHRAADLARPAVVEALRDLASVGRIGRYGASVYTAEEARAALAVEGLGAIQAPANAFNTQALQDGLVEGCRAAGVLLHLRSVLLQGVLLIAPDALPRPLAGLAPSLQRLGHIAEAAGRSVMELAIGFVASQGADGMVIGFDAARQVGPVASVLDGRQLAPSLAAQVREIAAGVPQGLADPRTWPSGRGASLPPACTPAGAG